MAEEKQQSAFVKKLTGYVKTSSRSLALMLGGRMAQLTLLFLGFMIAGWLLYVFGWLPLQQETILPAGVSARNPDLDSKLLQIINSERIERANYQTKSLNAFGPLFAPISSPNPSLVP